MELRIPLGQPSPLANAVVVTLIFAGIAAAAYVFAIRPMREHDWPTAQGTYASDRTGTSPGGGRFGAGSRNVEVSFSYTVAGKPYAASHRFGALSDNPEGHITLWRGGAAMTVFYDPDDPKVCTLEPGPNLLFVCGFAVLVLLLGFAVASQWYLLFLFTARR